MTIPLRAPTSIEVTKATHWWLTKRRTWVLDRALPVWLTQYGAGGEGYEWDATQDGNGPIYELWRVAVLQAAFDARRSR